MNDIAARVYRNVGGGMVLFGLLMMWLGIGLYGILLVLVGGALFLSQFIVEGTHKLIESASRPDESDWAGELLYTEGGQFRIRHSFDANGQPRFVASDICRAIGKRPPPKDALKWGGAALLMHGEHACFSVSAVQTYLLPLVQHNHEANLLLIRLRNEVFRKLDKQREQESNASQASVI